jgi:hypothetical protein
VFALFTLFSLSGVVLTYAAAARSDGLLGAREHSGQSSARARETRYARAGFVRNSQLSRARDYYGSGHPQLTAAAGMEPRERRG